MADKSLTRRRCSPYRAATNDLCVDIFALSLLSSRKICRWNRPKAFLSPAAPPSSASPNSPCGGCASGLPSSASNPVTRNKRSTRAHALEVEKRSYEAGCQKPPTTTGEVRSLHRLLQPRAASSDLTWAVPCALYRISRRPYTGLSDLEYPSPDRTVTVTACGRICIGRRKINLSQVFAGQMSASKKLPTKSG